MNVIWATITFEIDLNFKCLLLGTKLGIPNTLTWTTPPCPLENI